MTRADFYIGRGTKARWIASVAADGYPDGILPESPKRGNWAEGEHLFQSTTEAEFLARLEQYLEGRDDVTRPELGWPWPWDDSRTTDYAYALDEGRVWASNFGGPWFDPMKEEPDRDAVRGEKVEFPNMKSVKKVTLGPRSGLIVFGANVSDE